MDLYKNISNVASLIADRARTAMLMALVDGQPMSAGELAHWAKITPQTASHHLARLVEAGLLIVQVDGRSRHYSLADKEVAKLLESFSVVAPPGGVRSLRESDELQALKRGRLCFDHLAGTLGVGLTKSFIEMGYLMDRDGGYVLTDVGGKGFLAFGVHLPHTDMELWSPAHKDWTERGNHFAGPLAANVTARLFELEWIGFGSVRRTILVTPAGTRGFETWLGSRLAYIV